MQLWRRAFDGLPLSPILLLQPPFPLLSQRLARDAIPLNALDEKTLSQPADQLPAFLPLEPIQNYVPSLPPWQIPGYHYHPCSPAACDAERQYEEFDVIAMVHRDLASCVPVVVP